MCTRDTGLEFNQCIFSYCVGAMSMQCQCFNYESSQSCVYIRRVHYVCINLCWLVSRISMDWMQTWGYLFRRSRMSPTNILTLHCQIEKQTMQMRMFVFIFFWCTNRIYWVQSPFRGWRDRHFRHSPNPAFVTAFFFFLNSTKTK